MLTADPFRPQAKEIDMTIQQTLAKTDATTQDEEKSLIKRTIACIAVAIIIMAVSVVAILTLLLHSLPATSASANSTVHEQTSTSRLSSACDNKPSAEVKRGEVTSFNGTKIWFSSQGQPYNGAELLHFDGPRTFSTIVNRPAGGTMDNSIVEYDRTVPAAASTNPIEVWSPSPYGYSLSMTVC